MEGLLVRINSTFSRKQFSDSGPTHAYRQERDKVVGGEMVIIYCDVICCRRTSGRILLGVGCLSFR
jgi:hypothetical protein